MKLKLLKTTGFLAACGMTFCMTNVPANAAGVNSGVLVAISSFLDINQSDEAADNNGDGKDAGDAQKTETDAATTATGQKEEEVVCGYKNLGIAKVDSSLNVREAADENSNLVGKMQNNAGCEILEQAGDWFKIQSGEVTGYVKGEYLITGDDAKKKAQEVQTTVATVTADSLNLRADMNTECTILAQMPKGEELEVLEDHGDWFKVDLDGDQGYAHKDYVQVTTQLPKAQTMTELKYGQGVSNVRVDLVAFATQFVGNRYVWGGTSLTKGTDCSGFTLRVMEKYGVKLPRTSREQAKVGTRVNAKEAKPGDLFFYGTGNGINHVAIYIGNGQIVHASSPKSGIKISNAFYRSPICAVRVLGD